MKNSLATVLVLALVFSLSACGKANISFETATNSTLSIAQSEENPWNETTINPTSSIAQNKENLWNETTSAQTASTWTANSQDPSHSSPPEAAPSKDTSRPYSASRAEDASSKFTSSKFTSSGYPPASVPPAADTPASVPPAEEAPAVPPAEEAPAETPAEVTSRPSSTSRVEDSPATESSKPNPNYSPDKIKLSSLSVTDQHFYEQINDSRLVKDTVGNTYATGNLFAIGSGSWYTGARKPPFATYYLGGKYSKLTLDIAIYADGGTGEAYFLIHNENDKVLYQTDYINRQFSPQKLTLDVTGMEWITFKFVERNQMDDNVVMLLSDPTFHK